MPRSSNDVKCACNWGNECKNWREELFGSEDMKLGKWVRLEYTHIRKAKTKLASCVNETEKDDIRLRIEKWERYRHCVLTHLHADKEFYRERDIFVARHHFPHEFLRKKSNKFSFVDASLSRSEAESYRIGIYPYDKVDIIPSTIHNTPAERRYFLAPSVTKKEMESFMNEDRTRYCTRKYKHTNESLITVGNNNTSNITATIVTPSKDRETGTYPKYSSNDTNHTISGNDISNENGVTSAATSIVSEQEEEAEIHCKHVNNHTTHYTVADDDANVSAKIATSLKVAVTSEPINEKPNGSDAYSTTSINSTKHTNESLITVGNNNTSNVTSTIVTPSKDRETGTYPKYSSNDTNHTISGNEISNENGVTSAATAIVSEQEEEAEIYCKHVNNDTTHDTVADDDSNVSVEIATSMKVAVTSKPTNEKPNGSDACTTTSINPTEDHEEIVSESNHVDRITNTDHYLGNASFFIKKIGSLINGKISELKCNSSTSNSTHSKSSYISDLNKLLREDVHYRNICIILSDMLHYNTTCTTLCKDPCLYLLMCPVSSKSGNTTPEKFKCERFYVSLYKKTSPLCNHCQLAQRNTRKCQIRYNKNKFANIEPSSKVNLSTLHQEDKQRRSSSQRKRLHLLQSKLEKVMDHEEKVPLHSKNLVESQIMEFMSRAGTVSPKTKDQFKSIVVKCIEDQVINNSYDNDDDNADVKSTIELFVDDVLTKIQNFQHVLQKNPKQVQFTAQEIRLALILYNMTPSGYKEIKDSSIQIMPSVDRLKQYKQQMKVREGRHPELYGTLRDRLCVGHKNVVLGTIMVDEMKLKHDLYSNVTTGEIIGFASNDLSLQSCKDNIQSMFRNVSVTTSIETPNHSISTGIDTTNKSSESSEEKNSQEVVDENNESDTKSFNLKELEEDKKVQASYVNQWRLRTLDNKTASLEFFFNDGSLSGNELLSQLFHVLAMLNNVNIRALMLAMDAGGNNSRLASLLRHEAKLGEEAWLDYKLVTFKDPTADHQEKEQLVCIIHCSTHNQKSTRNALKNSSSEESSSRLFVTVDGVYFTWESCVEACFHRDCKRQTPVTKLCMASVYINSWNKMRVGFSLRPFSERTIVEQFVYLGEKLGCTKELCFSGALEEDKDIVKMYRRRMGILQSRIKSSTGKVEQSLLETYAGLEYCVHIACIFNERFMNKAQKITRENIDSLRDEMMVSLKYFEEWRKATIKRKASGKKGESWEKGCISKQTYNNLRVQICGFFKFAEIVFELDKNIQFIPFLYSNTSSLESHFSEVRAKGADTPQRYISTVPTIDYRKTCKTFQYHSNEMYDGTVDESETQVCSGYFDDRTMSRAKHRKAIVDSWLETGKLKRRALTAQDTITAGVIDIAEYEKYRTNRAQSSVFDSSPLVVSLKSISLPSGFLHELIESTDLVESAVSSVESGSPTEMWFKELISLGDPDDIKSIDKLCQKIVAKVLYFFEETCYSSGNRSKSSSFWYLVYKAIDKEEMFHDDGIFSDLPNNLQPNQTGKYIILESVITLVEAWMNEFSIEADKHKNKGLGVGYSSTDDRNRQVNGFVGYALSSVLQKYKRLAFDASSQEDMKLKNEYDSVIDFLKQMRILHQDAMNDKRYSAIYYASTDMVLNHGGLALISPNYLEFGEYLISLCNDEINESIIYKRREKSFILARDHILTNKNLREKFDQAHHNYTFKSNSTKNYIDDIYSVLVIKTIRSKFGAVLKKVRENKFGHFATTSSKDTLRADLKFSCKRKMKQASGIVDESSAKKTKLDMSKN